jgi:signal transduction histidine kinase
MAYVTTNLGLMERDIRDAAERGVLPREYAQMIGDVVEGTQRVNEVLKALRPYARRADWTVEVVDLKSAVESAQALVAEEAAGRVQIAPDFGALPRVKGRSQEIGQVLHGLLARAVNESPADGRVLVRGEAKGDRVWVEIERDGEEIPPDERERLFEPFSAESARAGRHDLVLWTARSIAREHGGDLTLENAQGRGACFRLALPLAPPRAEPPAPPGPPAPRDA